MTRYRPVFFALALAAAAPVSGCGSLPRWARPAAWFGGGDAAGPDARLAEVLETELALSPAPLALSETRRLQAVFRVRSRAKAPVNLEFAGEQRFDAEVADERGKVLAKWSDDRVFSRDPAFVAVNPGEELVYTAVLPTRDLKPGRAYTVDAYLSGHETVRARAILTPVK